MPVPPRITFVTLACRDIERTADVFRALGWPEAPSSEPVHRVFQLSNGVVLGLYGADNYERTLGPMGEGFRGFTLAVNLASPAEVDDAYATLQGTDGVELLEAPQDMPWGGRGFSFRDPEGNVWDVVWAEGTTIDERGGLTFP